jgi:hypothetical protein
MFTLLNLGIILMLLIMVAIWATYGFFSAFVQLIIIIASGVLALAFWEPVTYMLLGRMPAYAHGVGLLAPFVLLLIIIRTLFDKLCRANVHMPRIADQIGGGACGLFSGILAIGFLLNGANFLPMHREVMGWEAYLVDGNKVTENEDAQLWGFVRVNEWSADFFEMVSVGSMRPTGGTPLAEGRPNLAKRALLTRMTADENQLRTANPGSVKVAGVYDMPANEEAIYGLAQRSAVLAFLSPAYTLPNDIDYGEDGMGLVNGVFNELNLRHEDPTENGKPSEMINVDAIMQVSRIPQFKFESATSLEGFPSFVQNVADKMGADMVKRLAATMGKGKRLYIVDTAWNNEYPGTFNTDNKLRIAIPQVRLMAGGEEIAPIGYSIQYSQNTGGRIFTEIISDEADVSLKDQAYSKYTETNIAWVFPIADGQRPDFFFVRELRFDLSDLKKPEGQETRENRNPGAVAHVLGAPLLPSPEDLEKENEGQGTANQSGVKIAGTDTYAEVSERLPSTFSGSAVSYDFNKNADPWTIIAGLGEDLPRGKGGQTSSVNRIDVANSDRLVRLNLDPQRAKSLLGRFIQAAEDLTVMKVKDEGGNDYDSIGFALLKADRTMHIDIRSEAARNRGVSAGELPRVGPGETLMVYFQVPIGTKLTSFVIGGGDGEMKFEEILEVTKSER